MLSKKIDRIIVTGDTLRPTNEGTYYNQTRNIKWIYNLLRFQISQATNTPVLLKHNKNQSDYLKQYTEVDDIVTFSDWAKLFETPTDNLTQLLQNEFHGSLVIGYELPLSMKKIFNKIEVPYVDIMLHPIRFMDDIFFCFNSNVTEIKEKIIPYELSRQEVQLSAGAVMAAAAHHNPISSNLKDCVLYAAQTPTDRSMISNGTFLSSLHIADIAAPQANGKNILYKDHPMQSTPIIKDMVQDRSNQFENTSDNIYDLLCADEVTSVMSISSSVCHEAEFFGKKSTYLKGLSTPVRYRDDPNNQNTNEYHSVYDEFLNPDFWRDILSPILKVTEKDGFKTPRRINFLRNLLGLYWGYNTFACDPIIKNATINPLEQFPKIKTILMAFERILSNRTFSWLNNIRKITKRSVKKVIRYAK